MNIKTIVGLLLLIVLIGGAIFFLSKSNSTPMNMPSQTQTAPQANPTTGSTVTGQNAVTIQNFAFSPATLTIKVGDKVTWTNQDSAPHSATADDNSFDTGVISQ